MQRWGGEGGGSTEAGAETVLCKLEVAPSLQVRSEGGSVHKLEPPQDECSSGMRVITRELGIGKLHRETHRNRMREV